MQNPHGPASPVIEQPTHDDPRNLMCKVQPRRLTDSHLRRSNPGCGFELMKMACACAVAHWRNVNPAKASSADLIIRDARGFCDAERVSPAKIRPKRITSVDNVMTLT
jgi:hypothetical protein